MKGIEKEIKELIDSRFNVDFNLTGNKLIDQSEKAKLLNEITEKVADDCVDILNKKYPDQAKGFAESGYKILNTPLFVFLKLSFRQDFV